MSEVKKVDWEAEIEKEKDFGLELNDVTTEKLCAEYVMCQCLMSEDSQVTLRRAVRQKMIFDEIKKRARQESLVVRLD